MTVEKRADVQDGVVVNVVVVQAGAVPPAMADWPVVDGVGPGWVQTEDGSFAPPPAPPPTAEDVAAERDRRLQADFTFQGVQFQRDPTSIARISGAGTLALGAIVKGAQPGDLRWPGGDEDFVWIASDNSEVPMDAQTCFAFGQAAAAVETRMIFAAKALREMDPIPADFADDGYWP